MLSELLVDMVFLTNANNNGKDSCAFDYTTGKDDGLELVICGYGPGGLARNQKERERERKREREKEKKRKKELEINK